MPTAGQVHEAHPTGGESCRSAPLSFDVLIERALENLPERMKGPQPPLFTSVLYMSMSLDRYIGGPNDEPDNSGVDGFIRLHDSGLTPTGISGRMG